MTEVITEALGSTTSFMGTESGNIQMVISMKETLKMVKPITSESTHTQTGVRTKDSGKMTLIMDMVLKFERMEQL